MDEIRARLEHFPKKSLRHLAQETGLNSQVLNFKLAVSKKEFQNMNVNILHRCKECKHNHLL
jgi:hypothetical protein